MRQTVDRIISSICYLNIPASSPRRFYTFIGFNQAIKLISSTYLQNKQIKITLAIKQIYITVHLKKNIILVKLYSHIQTFV